MVKNSKVIFLTLVIGVHGVLHGGTAEPLREARALGTLDSQSSSVFSQLGMTAEVSQEKKTKVQKLLSVGTLKSGATWAAKETLPVCVGIIGATQGESFCKSFNIKLHETAIKNGTCAAFSAAGFIAGYKLLTSVQSCIGNAVTAYQSGVPIKNAVHEEIKKLSSLAPLKYEIVPWGLLTGWISVLNSDLIPEKPNLLILFALAMSIPAVYNGAHHLQLHILKETALWRQENLRKYKSFRESIVANGLSEISVVDSFDVLS